MIREILRVFFGLGISMYSYGLYIEGWEMSLVGGLLIGIGSNGF